MAPRNEKLYKKVGNKYVEVSVGERYEMTDGIWLVQSGTHSKSVKSLMWKVGDIKRPVDVVTHAALYSLEDKLSKYLLQLNDTSTIEWQDLKKKLQGYLNGPVGVYNISISDFIGSLLTKMAEDLEMGEKASWDRLHFKFREEVGLQKIEKMTPVELLYEFTEWAETSGITFKWKD